MHALWTDFINLTMSYKLNSDIFYPFGVFEEICYPEKKNFRCDPEISYLDFRQKLMG